jgi:thiamine biosynthesis protein ThiS
VKNKLESLGVEVRGVAVERNLAIVPKSTFAETLLCEGDLIEIVEFIGGG